MRNPLLLLFLITVNTVFSQEDSVSDKPWAEDPKNQIWDHKWYMNAAQISYFSWNDTSSLVTSTPFDDKFIRFQEKLEFGQDSPLNDVENTFFEYRFYFDDYENYGTIDTYKKSRHARRRNKSLGYYDFYYNEYQLILTQGEKLSGPFDNLYFNKSIVFSLYRDTLEFTTKILGNWKPQVVRNICWMKEADTLVLDKESAGSLSNPGFAYNFSLYDSRFMCSSDCFSILSDGNGFPDGYWPLQQYDYALDIAKKQLIIFGNKEWEKPNKVFDIIELTNTQMKLVPHQN